MEKKGILFVDDEKQILKALRRLFIQSEYETYYADNGNDALEILESNNISLLITDVRMPGMDGFELMKRVKETYPTVVRVALSGYTDSNRIYKALEENLARLYLFKPWDNMELINIINGIFYLEETLKNNELFELINSIDELPSLPNIYTKLCRMIEADEDVSTISKVLDEDAAISSRVLRIANSAFYGSRTGSINQAIMYIGLSNVRSIILTNGIINSVNKGSEYIKDLWKHFSTTNQLSKMFFEKIYDKKMPPIYGSAGLLHDIGKLVIIQNDKEKYKRISDELETSDETYSEIEKNVLDIGHELLGGYLLNWWGIPVPIVEAALFHHDPLNDNCIYKDLAITVNIANYYSWEFLKIEKYQDPMSLDVLDYLNIEKDVLDGYFESFKDEIKIMEW